MRVLESGEGGLTAASGIGLTADAFFSLTPTILARHPHRQRPMAVLRYRSAPKRVTGAGLRAARTSIGTKNDLKALPPPAGSNKELGQAVWAADAFGSAESAAGFSHLDSRTQREPQRRKEAWQERCVARQLADDTLKC